MPKQLDAEITNLGDVLEFVAQSAEDVPTRIVHEHLRDACQNLARGTHRDYVQELKYALRATGRIHNSGLRKSLDRMITELIDASGA